MNALEHMLLQVSVVTLFSRYALLPANGLDFGPHLYNTQSEAKILQICNHGKFAFDFCISCPRAQESTQAEEPKEQAPFQKGKGKEHVLDKGKAAEAPTGSICVGPFVIEPSKGNVLPGCNMQIQVCALRCWHIDKKTK
jgi:hypothetical protein